MKIHHYYVYILQCSDGSFYIGVTNNLDKRIDEHQVGIIPTCYTFKRRPIDLKYYEVFTDIKQAISREKQLKGWSRKKKLALINENYELLKLYSKNSKESPSTTLRQAQGDSAMLRNRQGDSEV